MKYMIKIYVFFVIVTCFSCKDWLNQTPYDKIPADDLYENESGVLKVINGIYLSLANSNLYGQNLTCTTLEVLAQHYYIPNDEHSFYQISEYNYSSNAALNRFSSIWSRMYHLIADCNVFLREIEANKENYNPENYKLYRGEALALRTYLHFDLFRLYGPVYYEDEQEKEAIPYYSRYTDLHQPFLNVGELKDSLLLDIDEAISLLTNDPILENNGPENNRGDEWDYRGQRMNLFAAYSLKARMLQYYEKSDEAYKIVSSLLNGLDPITEEPNNFNNIIIGRNQLTETYQEPMFFTEMIFCIYNTNKSSINRNSFSSDLIENAILAGLKDYIDNIFYEVSDPRTQFWTDLTDRTPNLVAFLKYTVRETNTASYNYRYMLQPLIRLGELYLIAADCAANDDLKRYWINQLRLKRNYADSELLSYDPEELIKEEYIKELYGEGQYFYYLKRKKLEIIETNSEVRPTISNMLGNYQVPYPESEINNRN